VVKERLAQVLKLIDIYNDFTAITGLVTRLKPWRHQNYLQDVTLEITVNPKLNYKRFTVLQAAGPIMGDSSS